MSKPRLRGFWKWIGLAAFSGTLTLCLISMVLSFEGAVCGVGMVSDKGVIAIHWGDEWVRGMFPKRVWRWCEPRLLMRLPGFGEYGKFGPSDEEVVIGRSVDLPLWLPVILFGVPTAYLFIRDAVRGRPGHCTHCGYDLTGNTSGTCPECGERI